MTATMTIRTSSQTLLDRLAAAREATDNLFELVEPIALYDRPIPERHRIVFYMGHLDAFDWNLLQPVLPGVTPFDAALDRLFAFGIDPVDGQLPSDQRSDWPSLAAVAVYTSRVRAVLDAALARSEVSPQLLNTAIEHRWMHAETLAYMLHQLPAGRKLAVVESDVPSAPYFDEEMVDVPEGSATLGLARGGEAFGWDNEFDAHTVSVPGFTIDRYKVTNHEFLAFIHADGYENPEYWTKADWAWRSANNITHPVFWRQAQEGWHYRGMFSDIPLPSEWPVYVSHAEASAYARWAGKRLPTEAEWHRAAFGASGGHPDTEQIALTRWDPRPVNSLPDSPMGVTGMFANGWEWTSTLFAPFEGFEAFPFYPGYSANFFDDKHYVLKGGSTRTHSCMLRPSFRNWFQPHYQYVYAGFRCIGD
jgi:ergothioneine biosynthesis protein EgtB